VIGIESKKVEFQIGSPMKDKIVTCLAWLAQFEDQDETQVCFIIIHFFKINNDRSIFFIIIFK